MSDITLSPSNTIDVITDALADQKMALGKGPRPAEESAAAERLASQKANIQQIINLLHYDPSREAKPNAFNAGESKALATRIAQPDAARELAYVPSAIAKEHGIAA